jgi:branched-chain amino acid transport system permease protein
MGVTESLSREGVRSVVEQPAVLALALAGAYLVVDLLAKLAGVTVAPGGVFLLGGSIPVSQVASFVVDGLVLGLVVGLAGVGLSMTYSILNFANFAHGDYVTAGAFAGFAVAYVVAFLLGAAPDAAFSAIAMVTEPSLISVAVLAGLLAAAGITVAVGLGLDRIVYKPMRDREGISLLIASIGVALALRYAITFVFDTGTRGVTATGSIPTVTVGIVDGTVNFNLHEATLTVAAVALMLGVHLLLQRTKLGTAMRAMADNKSLAQVTGIPTERVVRATWIIGSALAGIAGFLIVLEKGTISFNVGWRLLLLIFSGVILGGIGSVYGAMGGGIIIGLASRLSLVWIPSDFARVAAFGVMILVLLYRPSGLFRGVTTA